jgi:hypothetical protein
VGVPVTEFRGAVLLALRKFVTALDTNLPKFYFGHKMIGSARTQSKGCLWRAGINIRRPLSK